MPNICLVQRLDESVTLTAAERTALLRLKTREEQVARGGILQQEAHRPNGLFVVQAGIVMSYRLLRDGRRQILQFYYPGDLVGLSGLFCRTAPEGAAAVRHSIVTPIDRNALAGVLAKHPRLSALLAGLGQIERTLLSDRLAAIGRGSAKARVAALLLELCDRAGDREDAPFYVPLTQEEIGDATGLTAVHVNRMMRELEQEALIERTGGQIRIIDRPRLLSTSDYMDRRLELELELDWIPNPN